MKGCQKLLITRTQLFEGRVALTQGKIIIPASFLLFKSIFSYNFFYAF